MNYSEQMQLIVHEYQRAGEHWPATTRMIADWAVRTRRWRPTESSMVDQCADRLGRAMREEYITDAQGRRVRAKHAATVRDGNEQLSLWADIRTATPEHMKVAFQQRRRSIVGDCKQLKTDVDSWNENNVHGVNVQLSLDFTYDVEEAELSFR